MTQVEAQGLVDKAINDTVDNIINMIIASPSVKYIFPDGIDYKDLYKKYISKIHPDVCDDPQAPEAVAKLNHYRDILEKGYKHMDDGLSVVVNASSITYEGVGDALSGVLQTSQRNYLKLMHLKDDNSAFFKAYIPSEVELVTPNKLVFKVPKRVLSLNSLPWPLEQHHVNWILNRMFEFSAWINQTHNVHCGINPDSIFICPEDHGLICGSFHHMTKAGGKVSTISGKWSGFYPAEVFKNKQASTNIDIELAKRTAIYLLGDKSGIGNSLRKTHDNEVINFLQKGSYSPYDTITEYKSLLKAKFPTKFHELAI